MMMNKQETPPPDLKKEREANSQVKEKLDAPAPKPITDWASI